MPAPKVVIFNDSHGWHSEQLRSALQQYGISSVFTDLAACAIDLDSPTGLAIPGFAHQLPAAAIVRGIAPGSLEQITLRMDVLHTLAELKIPVLNPASTIEHTVDKARTSLRLHLAGIAAPKTWACEDKAVARDIAAAQFANNNTLVIKPLFGCMGKGISKIATLAQFDRAQIVGGAFYLQQYIEPVVNDHWQDWRIMVIDNQVCAAMTRHSQHWITNVAQGAHCIAAKISPAMAQLAIKATQAVQADYAGVDIIRDAHGNSVILEVNSVPAWKGLSQATGINIAAYLAQALAKRIDLPEQRLC